MSAKKLNITKCHYRYSQINNFISVKDFMFVRENGINHLLIRFCNDSKFTINELAYTIIELDASGKVINNLKIRESNLDIQPGCTHSPHAGFNVSSDCCDCKVIIRRAVSGDYIYQPEKNKIVTDYRKPVGEIIENGSNSKSKALFYVNSTRSRKARAPMILSLICLFTLITLNAARPFAIYYKDDIKEFIKESAEAIIADITDFAETDDSREAADSSK